VRRGRARLALGIALAIAGAGPALATGPSSIRIRLRPIAVGAHGEVLLRTWREANPTGRHALPRVDLGWLLVSARGLWLEAAHRSVVPDEARPEASAAAYAEAEAEFQAPLDWAAPPESARALLADHGLGRGSEVKGDEGAGALTWTSERACAGARCTSGYLAQRTVGRLEGRGARGAPLQSAFFRAGVAVFRNTIDAEGRQRGAHFEHPGSARAVDPVEGEVELGFDVAEVDAVAVVRLGAAPPSAR
jgi:hypothetical protein